MAAQCECSEVNCEFDTGDDGICPKFLRQQTEEYLRLAQVTSQAQQALNLAQAQAQLAQAQLAQVQAQQLAYAQQQQIAAIYEHAQREEVARAMIRMSGVNDVPCHVCNKNCNGLVGLKTHVRCHYIPFRCDVCNWEIRNNNSVTVHLKKCSIDSELARAHFQGEEERLLSSHKAAYPALWTTLSHKAF
jgi:hypothetical protein